jgi:hypothetical protein
MLTRSTIQASSCVALRGTRGFDRGGRSVYWQVGHLYQGVTIPNEILREDRHVINLTRFSIAPMVLFGVLLLAVWQRSATGTRLRLVRLDGAAWTLRGQAGASRQGFETVAATPPVALFARGFALFGLAEWRWRIRYSRSARAWERLEADATLCGSNGTSRSADAGPDVAPRVCWRAIRSFREHCPCSPEPERSLCGADRRRCRRGSRRSLFAASRGRREAVRQLKIRVADCPRAE